MALIALGGLFARVGWEGVPEPRSATTSASSSRRPEIALAAATSHQQALELFCELGDQYGRIDALIGLGDVLRLAGDYRAAAASPPPIRPRR
jgi:hypothetical protein